MKNTVTLIALFFVLCSFKGDIPVNPKYFGTWRCVLITSDKKLMEYIIYIKQNSKSNKFDVYRKQDADGKPFYTATMLDATHFKAKNDENPSASEEITHKIAGYWDGDRLLVDDHVEKSIVNNRAHSTTIYDNKRVYLRWNEETKQFSDSLSHGAMQVTGGSNNKEGTTKSSFSSTAPRN